MSDGFKKCSACSAAWATRDGFLSDPNVDLVGYQADFRRLQAGLFLFAHRVPSCQTTLAVRAAEFRDLYEGPVFERRLTGTAKCRGYCLRESNLEPCPEECECAFVRRILDRIRHWKRH